MSTELQTQQFAFPSRWRVVSFDDAFDDVTGGNSKLKNEHFLPSGKLPIIDQGQRTIAGYTDDFDLVCKASLPCVLFGDHTKIFKFVDFPFVLGADGVKVLRPRKELDPRFAFHYLSQVTLPGDAGYSRHFKFLRRISVPLPSDGEQRRIATILDKADAIRRRRREVIKLTEQLLRSTFLEMFGSVSERISLEKICRRVTDGTHQPPKWAPHGLPFIFVSNIEDHGITFETKKFVSEQTWTELTVRCPIEANDILYTTVGSYGNAAIVTTGMPRFAFQRHIAHIKPDVSLIDPFYLLGALQSPGVRRQADEQARGIAQKTLNLAQLKKFEIPYPSREHQERYARLRRAIADLLAKQLQARQLSDLVFSSLVQRAFSGQL